jgi:predicted nucleotidyltransferase
VATREEIADLVKRIVQEFDPERIILFGSHAAGNPTADSDVDLLVVVRHEGKSWQQATRIRNALAPSFPLDLLVRSPDDVQWRLSQGDPFFREIADHGEVLFEADHA